MASFLMQTIREYTREMTNNGLPSFGAEIDPEQLRSQVEVAQAEMPLQPGVIYEACELGGIEAELSMPSYAREDAIIMYMHGGGGEPYPRVLVLVSPCSGGSLPCVRG